MSTETEQIEHQEQKQQEIINLEQIMQQCSDKSKELKELSEELNNQKQIQSRVLQDISEKQSQLHLIDVEVESKTKIFDHMSAQVQQKEKNANENLQKQDSTVKEKMKQLETQIEYYEGEVRRLENNNIELKKLNQDYQQEKLQEYEQLQKDNETLICENQVLLKQLSDQSQQLTQINNETSQVQQTEQNPEQQNQEVQIDISIMDDILRESIIETLTKIQQQCIKEEEMQSSQKESNESNTEKFLKLQKKLNELESYIEEKDKTILEQENQLLALQNQLNEKQKQEENYKQQLKEQIKKSQELEREIQFTNETYEEKISDLYKQLQAKDQNLQDAWQAATDKEHEVTKYHRQVKEAEEAIRELRLKYNQALEQQSNFQGKYQDYDEEMEQMKVDFQQILNFKNDLEELINEQTQHIEKKNKKIMMLEETLKFKESELDKKDNLLRRITTSIDVMIQADETKKKLMSSEVKLRQVTQTTMKDLKNKIKEKSDEIEVLKEMVRSSNKQAKAKDIDIARLTKRLQRLEKLTELNQGIIQPMNMPQNELQQDEIDEIQQEKSRPDLGLNPAYYSVEEEVERDLFEAQQQRQFQSKSLKQVKDHKFNLRQKEIEEAIELDKMLQQERRNQSQDIFQKKQDERFENYFNNINVPNYKNTSQGVKGLLGFGQGGESNAYPREDQSNISGMFPNLNVSKREQLEQELQQDFKKDKFMTPGLQGKTKSSNKVAYVNQSASPYYQDKSKIIKHLNHSKKQF